jgi:hypothetical protein
MGGGVDYAELAAFAFRLAGQTYGQPVERDDFFALDRKAQASWEAVARGLAAALEAREDDDDTTPDFEGILAKFGGGWVPPRFRQ